MFIILAPVAILLQKVYLSISSILRMKWVSRNYGDREDFSGYRRLVAIGEEYTQGE